MTKQGLTLLALNDRCECDVCAWSLVARYRTIQLIDTRLQPLSWLFACQCASVPGSRMWHVQHWQVGNANLDPLASSLRGATPTPWLRIGSPTIVSHPAELQWLLARRAQPSQRCELPLLDKESSPRPGPWIFSSQIPNKLKSQFARQNLVPTLNPKMVRLAHMSRPGPRGDELRRLAAESSRAVDDQVQ